MKKAYAIVLCGVIALLFTKAFSIETVKDSSHPQSDTLEFIPIHGDSGVIVKPDSAITVFKDGSTQHSRRFNNERLHSIVRRGKQTIYGHLRWPRTLSPAVNIQVGFMVMDKKSKKLRVLCSALTNEKGYVKVEYPNTTSKKYPEFMRPGPAKDVEALRKHYNQALAHSLNNDYDAAIFEYFEALRYDPNAYQVLYNLGVAYFKKGLYDKAVFQFERYLELKPDAGNREETERIIERLREKLRESD